MKICIVIPTYNHGSTLFELLSHLKKYKLDTLIVDDASDQKTQNEIVNLTKQFEQMSFIRLERNQGKGGAVKAGLKHISGAGYTHVLQIDADGQHDLDDLPAFIKAANQYPCSVINGSPIYDKSAPKGRLYGRRITNFWVAIETWSKSIKDSMCGYRIYPYQQTLAIVERYPTGNRMSFDIEILVRLYWAGLAMISIPTKVSYYEGGISHFNMLKDNMKISLAHTRLFFGMLKRTPTLLKRLIYKNNKVSPHWSKTKERGSIWGLKFVLLSYKLVGRRIAPVLLAPISLYFYCVNGKARRSSKHYLQRVDESASSLKHFYAFSRSSFDTLSVWNDDIGLDQIEFLNKDLFLESAKQKRGGLILTAHFGTIEVARALAKYETDAKINALVFRQHAKKFNSILEEVSPSYNTELIEVTSITIPLVIDLKNRIEKGEYIVIAADRTSVSGNDRICEVNFLGGRAPLSQGPYIMASVLQCPVYFMLCYRQSKSKFKVIFDEFAEQIKLDSKGRETQINQFAQQYATLLEGYCKLQPMQWFNFYDFWTRAE